MAGPVSDGELEAYWAAVVTDDLVAAHAVAAAVVARGLPLDAVLTDLVSATQLRVGGLWAANVWTVAREHAATAVSEHVVRRLAEPLSAPATGPVLLVTAPEREWHALPGLVVATTLRSYGLPAEHLATNASAEQLVAAIGDRTPRAVLISASLASSLPRLRRQIVAVRATGTPVVVGGRAFDASHRDASVRRAEQLGATAYAANAREAADLVAGLPLRVAPAPELDHPGAVEARALLADADRLAREVLTATDAGLGLSGGGEAAVSPDDWRVVLATFVPHVLDCLAGALLTRDDELVPACRSWLGDVLAARDADPEACAVLWSCLGTSVRGHREARRLIHDGAVD